MIRILLAILVTLCAGLAAAHERVRTARLGLRVHDVEREILRLDADRRGNRAAVASLQSPKPLEERALAMGVALQTPVEWNVVRVTTAPPALAKAPPSPLPEPARPGNGVRRNPAAPRPAPSRSTTRSGGRMR